jgi:crotonobetainyl-CoA:carnitine CoA-transferase CaiB-like acyl-CoA transferase
VGLPLEGVRILELGQIIAGCFGTLPMADLGAEVIKVEPPQGEAGRNPSVGYLRGESALFLTFNRNKQSVVLDLKRPEGLQVFYDLVRRADVVLDNFRPGVLKRLKIDYETLKDIHPRIISCSVSGFGEDSPYRDHPSYDLIHQAMTGLMSITGEPGRPPVRAGIPVADLAAATFSCKGILIALLERERTGMGQRVEIAMFDALASLLTYIGTLCLSQGEVPPPPGSAHEYLVPYQAFKASDGFLVVATREDSFWGKLCEALGRPDLAEDPRFATNQARIRSKAELIPLLEDVFLGKPTGEWLAVLDKAGVPAAPVNALDKALDDPHLVRRDMLVGFDYPGVGPVRALGNPIKLSRHPKIRCGPPPTLGQHTHDVLSRVLGYPPERIEALRREGVTR